MATPNNARRTRNTPKDGAKADATPKRVKHNTFRMSVGRRPIRSASMPNSSAPTGRIASVQNRLLVAIVGVT